MLARDALGWDNRPLFSNCPNHDSHDLVIDMIERLCCQLFYNDANHENPLIMAIMVQTKTTFEKIKKILVKTVFCLQLSLISSVSDFKRFVKWKLRAKDAAISAIEICDTGVNSVYVSVRRNPNCACSDGDKVNAYRSYAT